MKKFLLLFLLLPLTCVWGIEIIGGGGSGSVDGTAISPTSVTATGNITSSAGTVSGVTISGTTVTGYGGLLTGISASPTSGATILKGDGAGGIANATFGTDYLGPTGSGVSLNGMTSGTTLVKGNGSGGFSNATPGTDYATPSSGTTMLKGNGAGGLANAVWGTDYLAPTGSGVSLTAVAPLTHKTTEDAINGLVSVNGAGTYTAKAIGTDVQAYYAYLNSLGQLSATTGYLYSNGVGALAWCSGTSLLAGFLETGTTVTLTSAREYYVCTSITTVTLPIPAAGYEFCIQNDNNVSSTITIAMPTGVMIENQARTAYSTAGTGHGIRSSGAVKDQICIVGKDPTHYNIWSITGTWTVY